MTKINCTDISCKWYNGGTCTAKKVSLVWHQVHTVYGFQRYSRCKTYEESEFSKEVRKKFEHFMEGRK